MTKKHLIAHCLALPGVYEDYPFDEDWAAMRHTQNKKVFAFIYERHHKLCLNLKCEPMRADFLRQVYREVMPAYHMNKIHWNTIIVGGDVEKEAVFDMIWHSYVLTRPPVKNSTKGRI